MLGLNIMKRGMILKCHYKQNANNSIINDIEICQKMTEEGGENDLH